MRPSLTDTRQQDGYRTRRSFRWPNRWGMGTHHNHWYYSGRPILHWYFWIILWFNYYLLQFVDPLEESFLKMASFTNRSILKSAAKTLFVNQCIDCHKTHKYSFEHIINTFDMVWERWSTGAHLIAQTWQRKRIVCIYGTSLAQSAKWDTNLCWRDLTPNGFPDEWLSPDSSLCEHRYHYW